MNLSARDLRDKADGAPMQVAEQTHVLALGVAEIVARLDTLIGLLFDEGRAINVVGDTSGRP